MGLRPETKNLLLSAEQTTQGPCLFVPLASQVPQRHHGRTTKHSVSAAVGNLKAGWVASFIANLPFFLERNTLPQPQGLPSTNTSLKTAQKESGQGLAPLAHSARWVRREETHTRVAQHICPQKVHPSFVAVSYLYLTIHSSTW